METVAIAIIYYILLLSAKDRDSQLFLLLPNNGCSYFRMMEAVSNSYYL